MLSGCLLIAVTILSSCKKKQSKPVVLEECKVAIVLPFSQGMEQHWRQVVQMSSDNQTVAFNKLGYGVKLTFEWYDEEDPNLEQIAKDLARRDDIKAVVGGLYSSKAIILANQLSKADKPLFTMATTEQLVRAYSSWGNLWALTESDITQCEVLLTKAIQYGAKSVALIVKEDDLYGNTFKEWFAFQAKELQLENRGVITYTDDVEAKTKAAIDSLADYIICAPSEIKDLGVIIETYRHNRNKSKLLCSDMAYGINVINQLGKYAEGLEGVTYGSNPESGFDVAYKVRFNQDVSIGEAQVYDALMLIAYTSFIQMIKPDLSFKMAMRELVSGKDATTGGWRAEDMLQILQMIAHNEHPDISGASGNLNFDTKVYTNVLSTTYYNYIIYNKRYIILDYNSTDGSRRSEPTLAEWNWKKTQMQDIEDTSSIEHHYPPLDENWALLVATSSGWENYRHQVDVLNIYQFIKKHGYDDNHIVMIMEDDLAKNPKNPTPGVLISRTNGPNVYENAVIDYKTSEITVEDLKNILTGTHTAKLDKVIESDNDDNIFIFWSGHGTAGALCWLNNSYGVKTSDLDGILTEVQKKQNYRKIHAFIEACFSGSVANIVNNHDGMLFFTAANEQETSKADEYNFDMDVWMSNRFSATLQDCMAEDCKDNKNPDMPLRDLYFRLFQNTVGSHVCVYGINGYGSLYESSMREFLE